ncbi:LOW QUALITY PROTEIN: uncharacterized protein [Sylvia atricapilla]|uniref:LOW QUALITY PROTEIN: uncharacterized protein n=1 Tax=Sylvia atricapilla TaxID=48155 RepID=UPI003392242E
MHLEHPTGEKATDVQKHLVQAFSVLGIPKVIKTDNGPMYASKAFDEFLQQWGVKHKKGIPYSPTAIETRLKWYTCKIVGNTVAPLRPLIKTEYNYINEEDHDPHITTKEIPYTATELAKIKKEYSCLPSESEMEYVFRVSLTGGDQIKLSEQEASGYCGHGVFLTTGNTHAPWSLTQRAAYWAEGLSPLERGDPLAMVGTSDQLLENIHKAACLQMIHERKLFSGYESPMQQPVKPEIMTPLIRGLPESLKPTAILLQKTIAFITPVDRLERFLGHMWEYTSLKVRQT